MFRTQASDWKLRFPSPNPESSWQTYALCNSYDTDLFFETDNEKQSSRVRRERIAKNICAQCCVLMRCRAEGLFGAEPHGIWGGLSPSDRMYAKRPYTLEGPASFSRDR